MLSNFITFTDNCDCAHLKLADRSSLQETRLQMINRAHFSSPLDMINENAPKPVLA